MRSQSLFPGLIKAALPGTSTTDGSEILLRSLSLGFDIVFRGKGGEEPLAFYLRKRQT